MYSGRIQQKQHAFFLSFLFSKKNKFIPELCKNSSLLLKKLELIMSLFPFSSDNILCVIFLKNDMVIVGLGLMTAPYPSPLHE